MKHPNVAVIIHGFHQKAPSSQAVIWGDPANGLYGRVPAGLHIAWRKRASLLVFGSDYSAFEESEPEYWSRFVFANSHEIANWLGANEGEFRTWFASVASSDTLARNTQAELVNFFNKASALDIEELVLVSSPTHIARCLQGALILCEESQYSKLRSRISAVASDTVEPQASASDVVIIEPPHRIDVPFSTFYLPAKLMMPLQRDVGLANEYQGEWETLIGKYLDKLN